MSAKILPILYLVVLEYSNGRLVLLSLRSEIHTGTPGKACIPSFRKAFAEQG